MTPRTMSMSAVLAAAILLSRGAGMAAAQTENDSARRPDMPPVPAEPLVKTFFWTRSPGNAQTPHTSPLDPGWREHSFHDHTRYAVICAGGTQCLQAFADGAGSVLYRETDPVPTPDLHLTWSWRVNEFPRHENLASKGGDDRAAGVVILYHKSILPWKIRALIYVWSDVLPQGTVVPSPYAKDVKVMVLRTGRRSGWVEEDRDLAADYRRAFGEVPESVKALGVYTDADETKSEARAAYGPLYLFREPAGGLAAAGASPR